MLRFLVMTEWAMIRLAQRAAIAAGCLALLGWSAPGWSEELGDGEFANAEKEEEESSPYARSGIYLGIYGAVGVTTRLDDHIEITRFRAQGNGNRDGPFSTDPSAGVGVRAGYRFGPRFALEGHFEWMNEFSIAFDNSERARGLAASDIGTVETWAATANVRYYILTGRVQPYALVGLGVMHFDSVNTAIEAPGGTPSSPFDPNNPFRTPALILNISDEEGLGFASRFGGGLEIFLTESVAMVLGASYVLPTGDAQNFDYVSTEVGLQMRF